MKLATVCKCIILQIVLSLYLLSPLQAQNQNIGGTLTGQELLDYLRQNYTPNSTLGYNTARDRMYTILDNFDGVVICVYTYFEIEVDPNSSTPRADAYDDNNGINAEHLWPQSLGASNEPARSDLHHLYASEIRVNADRANFRFGNISDNQVSFWYNKKTRTSTAPPENERHLWSKLRSNDRFQAKDDRMGDIARAMFYFYTIYKNVADDAFFNSMYEDLLTWHDFDQVDDYEVWRTEQISGWQGNVNPFIMDTTLVRRAYFTEGGDDDSDDGDGDNDDDETDADPRETEFIFTETFGTPSSTTAISAHNYDSSELTFTGNGDIRSSIPSTGYEGASGDGLVFMNSGERNLTISNIDSRGYDSFTLTFATHTGNLNDFELAYSTGGGSWTAVSHNFNQNSSTWTLHTIEELELPASSNLSLRFFKDDSQQLRIDDISLMGLVEEEVLDVFTREVSQTAGWRLLTSPVTGMKLDDLRNQSPFTGSQPSDTYFYSGYDGQKFVRPASLSQEILPGSGFVWKLEQENKNVSEIVFTGHKVEGEILIALHSTGDKLNLIGNPFPEPIRFQDGTALNFVNGNSGSYWFAEWDFETGTYLIKSLETDLIKPFSSVIIYNNDAESLSLHEDMQTQTTASTGIPESHRTLSFNVSSGTGGLSDQSLSLLFYGDKETNHSFYHFPKLRPLADEFISASFISSNDYEITLLTKQAVPYEIDAILEFPLYLSGTYNGDYEIEIGENHNIPENWIVKLRDNNSGSLHDFPYTISASDIHEFVDDEFRLSMSAEQDSKDEAAYSILVYTEEIVSTPLAVDKPADVILKQNYPNPFNPVTSIDFVFSEERMITLRVFDMLGREVAVLVNEVLPPGIHTATWNAMDMSTGMYMYRLESGSVQITRKMTLVK